MTSPRRLFLAAACFTLALGLPFGRTATLRMPNTVLAQPILVQDEGTIAYGEGGVIVPIPGRLRMQYVPLLVPGGSFTVGAAVPGRVATARVPLVALLAAALLAWRRRAPRLARRAALAGGVALAATGVLAAMPSTGAVVSILGVGLLATIGTSQGRNVTSRVGASADVGAVSAL